MYIPKSNAEADLTVLYQFIRDNNFATLITQDAGQLTASHIPLMLDSERGVLRGHLARANDQWKQFGQAEALIIFQGTHAYISPTWYEVHPSVPTWNYAVVHVHGVPTVIEDQAIVEPMLRELVTNHEHGRDPEWTMDLPADYLTKMMQGIVAFEMPITRIEGKYKLSQNRAETDQVSVIAHLADSASALDQQTAHLMAARRSVE